MKEKNKTDKHNNKNKKQFEQDGVDPYDNIEGNEKKQTGQNRNRRVWISQDKEKDVEEKDLGQRGEGEGGEKKEKEYGGQNERLRVEER